MNKKKRRYRMKDNTNKINYIIIFFVILSIIMGSIFIKMGLDYKKNITPLYSFEAQKSNDYEVLLIPNDFYASQTLPSNRYYAAKSVNDYKVNFGYNFKADKETNLEYNYNITAEIVGKIATNTDQGKEVWARTFTILDNTSASIIDDEFSVNENVDIDYDYYNTLARLYEETYDIKIDATLKLNFNISYNINLCDLGVDNEVVDDYIELDIAITDDVTYAKQNYQESTNKAIMPNIQDNTNISIVFYIIGGIFLVFAIILILIRIKQKKKTPEEKYKSNIKRILKYYNDLIVTVTNEPNITDLKIMDIAILNDLIDVAEQNQSNIIHYEAIKDRESKLYVIIDKYVYIYAITDQKLL